VIVRLGEVPGEVATRFVYMAHQCADIHEQALVVEQVGQLRERVEAIARRELA
jgi:hypothetical protein